MYKYFVLGSFIFFTLRGWFVVNLNIPTQLVYVLSSILLVTLSIYGFLIRSTLRDAHLIPVKNLLLINLLMGVYFVVGEYLLGGSVDASLVYVFLAPYLLIVFMRLPVTGVNNALLVVALGLAFSIYSNYYNSVTLGGGYDYLMDYYTKLRPGFEGVSSSGANVYRLGGYAGSFHDSANVLGMLGVYFFTKFLICRKFKLLFITFLLFVAMFLTYSAANIVFAILTCFVFSLYVVCRFQSVKIYLIMLMLALLIISIVCVVPEIFGFIERVGSEGDYEGMVAALSVGMLSSPYFWIGHGYTFNSEWVVTEVALLKGVHQLGLIHATLLYAMLIYPLWFYLKNTNRSLSMLPYLAAIIFGFLSLLHYGSLFRITNVAIFFAMYALFFTHALIEKNIRP